MADTEWQRPPDISDFLLQGSDEEDSGGFELSDPPLDTEAEIMAYFCKNQTSSREQPDELSQKYSIQPSQEHSKKMCIVYHFNVIE